MNSQILNPTQILNLNPYDYLLDQYYTNVVNRNLIRQVIDGGGNNNLANIVNNMNLQNINGDTALFYAAEYNHVNVVSQLIKAGADVNLQDIHKETALMCASYKGHKEIVSKLLKANAKLNLKDDEGRTALIDAILEDNCIILTPESVWYPIPGWTFGSNISFIT